MKLRALTLFLVIPLAVAAIETNALVDEQAALTVSGKFISASADEAEREVAPQSTVQMLPDGKMQIGEVILDKGSRTVLIPAKVNMQQGTVEYALVMETGKTHESVFSTSATAQQIHTAFLLLGMNPASVRTEESVPSDRATEIEVSWDFNGKKKRFPLSECIGFSEGSEEAKKTRTLLPGPWLYNGSQLNSGGFAAMREGSVIAVITDTAALINNPGRDRSNDKIHIANAGILPTNGTPVRITLTLPPAKKSSDSIESARSADPVTPH